MREIEKMQTFSMLIIFVMLLFHTIELTMFSKKIEELHHIVRMLVVENNNNVERIEKLEKSNNRD